MTSTQPALAGHKISITTISWNQMDDIIAYLEAMKITRDAVEFEIEMILVDNGSVDGTPEMVERDYPWVKVIRNGKNEGFAVGCNVGLHASTGDFVMLLNPDAQANPESMTGMLTFMIKHPDVGGVGCMLMHEDGLPQLSAYYQLSPINYIRNHSFIYPYLERMRKTLYRLGVGVKKKPFRVDWVQASCLLVPKHVYEKVGDLESAFFIYAEDTDWCHRIRKAGYKIVHMPNLQMPHKQKGSVKRRPEFFFRRVYRSLLMYTMRQFSGGERDRILAVMLWDMRLRVPIYKMLAALKPAQRPALTERIESVKKLIAIVKSRNADLFPDPPPR